MLRFGVFGTFLDPRLLQGGAGRDEGPRASPREGCALGTRGLSRWRRPWSPAGGARRRERRPGRTSAGLRRPAPLTSPPRGRQGDGLISARVRAARLLATARSPALPPPGAEPRVVLASKRRQWGCVRPARRRGGAGGGGAGATRGGAGGGRRGGAGAGRRRVRPGARRGLRADMRRGPAGGTGDGCGDPSGERASGGGRAVGGGRGASGVPASAPRGRRR